MSAMDPDGLRLSLGKVFLGLKRIRNQVVIRVRRLRSYCQGDPSRLCGRLSLMSLPHSGHGMVWSRFSMM